MLSRVAEAVYWLGRYLERAENMARFIEVNWHLTLDMPQQDRTRWEPLVQITGDHKLFNSRYSKQDRSSVIRFLTFDADYHSSILSCLRMARENARIVRETIPPVMWEQINIFYHTIERMAREPEGVYENPFALCTETKLRSMMITGIANDSMVHGQGFKFMRLGRMLERADKTSRILDVKYFILLPSLSYVGTPYDDIQWAALLRSVSALEAYMQLHATILPLEVARFLLLNRDFPRSVLHCLLGAQWFLHSISGTPKWGFSNRAEQVLGRLCADLSFTDISSLVEYGLHEFVDNLQSRMNQVDEAIHATFLARGEAAEPPSGQQECPS